MAGSWRRWRNRERGQSASLSVCPALLTPDYSPTGCSVSGLSRPKDGSGLPFPSPEHLQEENLNKTERVPRIYDS